MRQKAIDILLESIDKSANSNTYWLTLSITEEKDQLEKDIIQHLKTGSFHFELVKEDINRGFNEFSEMIFPKGFDTPTFLQKPGNVWNGVDKLTMKLLVRDVVKDLLVDLLTGKQEFFSKSSLGTKINDKEAKKLVDKFLLSLDKFGEWKAYNIKTDFLNQIEDSLNHNFTKLGYFENCDRDLALAFKFDTEVSILLTNGYG